jgi:hypothetical protein
MARIFVGLAVLNTLALGATFAVGLFAEGRADLTAETPLSEAHRYFTLHLFGGLFSSLITLLVHSLVFTYFIGTGRWVQEVVKAYRLSESIWNESRGLKLKALPFILVSIALVITTATLGAATDRGMLDSTIHLALAVLALGCNLWSYVWEYQAIEANGNLITGIMAEVTRMRQQRGLS